MNKEFLKYYKIIAERKEKIISLEKELKNLKDKEFLQALRYFATLKNRGCISYTPAKENQYNLEFDYIKE